MENKFLRWLKRRGSWRMITRNGQPYLERYVLLKLGNASLYIHRFWQSDPDDPHCHPWWSMSYILKGGYREYFADGTYIDRKPGDKVLRDATTFHRVTLNGAKPGSAWTLFFTWKRKREWGFLTKDGWVPASEYSREKVAVYGKDFVYKGRLFPRIEWLTDRR